MLMNCFENFQFLKSYTGFVDNENLICFLIKLYMFLICVLNL